MIVMFKDGTQKEISSLSEIEFLPHSSGYFIAVDGNVFDSITMSYEELISSSVFHWNLKVGHEDK